MKSAKPFQNGRSMAVRIPKGFCIDDEKAFIKNSGNTPMLIPVAHSWSKMQSSICDMALRVLLTSALLLSAAGANAICAFQPITYGQTVNGSLSITDCTDDVSGSLYYADYYQFTGTAGEKIYIQQSSSTIDPWLALFFPSGDYTNNNNGGGGTTARIPATSGYYTLPESGTYLLEATSNVSNTTGSYTLTLEKEASTTILPSAPTNVTATAGNGSATVSFTPGSIGSGTLVTYWAACGVDNTHLIEAKGSSSPITVTGLTNGTVYYCWALTESTVGYSSKWSTVSNPVTPTAASTTSGTAIEFYNSGINHYFMTASSDEAASLDSKPSWGWARTGKTFSVWLTQASAPSNASPVCRFYGVFSNGTVGSHFYTIDQAECAYVKSRLDWGWNFEGNAFYAVKPTGGACPSGTAPVYRAYNNGMGGAPNHRYMTSQTDVNTMVSQGWSSEGIVMCAASGTNSGGTSTIFTLMTNPTDSRIFSAKASDGTTVMYSGSRDENGLPTDIDRIQVLDSNGAATLIELNPDNKLPKKMISTDGAVFNLAYNGTNGTVTAVSPDGATVATTIFSLPYSVGTANVAGNSVGGSLIHAGNGTSGASDSLQAEAEPEMRRPLQLGRYTPAAAGTSGVGDWVMSVNKCGYPADNSTIMYSISVPGSNADVGGLRYAKNAGNGRYIAKIPTGLKPSLTKQQIIDAAANIVGAVDTMCDILGQASHPEVWLAGMCPAIGVYLTPVTGPGGVAIGTACAAVSTAVMAYCKTLGQDAGIGAKSFPERLINAISDPSIYDATNINVHVQAAESNSLGNIYKMLGYYSLLADGPFPATTMAIPAPEGWCDNLLDGTWSGSWRVAGVGKNGCNYSVGGGISLTLGQSGSIYTGTVVHADGIEYRYHPPGTPEHPACSVSKVISASGGAVSAKRSGESVNLSFFADGLRYTGTLKLFAGGFNSVPNSMTGRITSNNWSGVGSIDLHASSK